MKNYLHLANGQSFEGKLLTKDMNDAIKVKLSFLQE